jgi:hypothetical protein
MKKQGGIFMVFGVDMVIPGNKSVSQHMIDMAMRVEVPDKFQLVV